jgi:hypothetical protein
MDHIVDRHRELNGEGVAKALHGVRRVDKQACGYNIVPFYCGHSNRAMENTVTDPAILAFLANIHTITNRDVLPAHARAVKRAEEMALLNRNVSGTPTLGDCGKPPVCSGNNCDVPVRSAPGLSFTTLLPDNSGASGAGVLPK